MQYDKKMQAYRKKFLAYGGAVDNEFWEKYAGHIGYSVCPSERRKGYATQMLREVLDYVLVGDCYIPLIELSESDDRPIGKWRRMHRIYFTGEQFTPV